jgi:NADPH:quinone reductase-like Zn-dependent oxidoreductase
MKALVVNALGRGFDLEDVDIASPIGREVLVEVQASGLCHTDLLFMVAYLRYLDTFAKIDGAWLFAERLLYVDWLEQRALS